MHSTLTRPLHAGNCRRPERRTRRKPGALRSGGLRGRDAAEGHAPAPSWGTGAAPALSQPDALPSFAAGIPRTLVLRRPQVRAAALAEALLAEGVLQQSDWQGDVVTSIGEGITRWATAVLGGDLQRIDLGLFWTDDIAQASGMNPKMWVEAQPGRNPHEPVGVIALVNEPWPAGYYPAERDCFVGRTVTQLNEVRPGLGFEVHNLLSDVLPVLIGTATLHYGYGEICKYQRLTPEQVLGLLEVPGFDPFLTPDRYLREVPRETVDGQLKPDVLRRAKGFRLPGRLGAIIDLACDVLGRFEALRSTAKLCDSHVLTAPTTEVACAFLPGHAAKLPSFSLRWSERDELPRVIRSYVGQLKGRGTNLAWCQGWQASDPEGLRRAVRHWRAVAACSLRACRLAELMHSEEPLC